MSVPIDDLDATGVTVWEWKARMVADLERVALRDRWGLGLILVGWCHLVFFLVEQALFSFGALLHPVALGLWAGELAANLYVFRLVVGKGWSRTTPLAGIILRLWITFLILSFNVASLNNLTGWSLDWFKPIWATLSAFVFMMLAYLINARYFFLAVHMYFTGLLMVMAPAWNYLIYGVSWWASLQGIGWVLESRRASAALPRAEAREPETTSAAA